MNRLWTPSRLGFALLAVLAYLGGTDVQAIEPRSEPSQTGVTIWRVLSQYAVLATPDETYSYAGWSLKLVDVKANVTASLCETTGFLDVTVLEDGAAEAGTPNLAIVTHSGGAHCCTVSNFLAVSGGEAKMVLSLAIDGESALNLEPDLTLDAHYSAAKKLCGEALTLSRGPQGELIDRDGFRVAWRMCSGPVADGLVAQ